MSARDAILGRIRTNLQTRAEDSRAAPDTRALAAYEAYAKQYADHYRQPAARLGQGRCLEQLGRLDEARAVYEDVMTASPDSAWAGQASSYLQVMPKPAAPAAAPTPAAKPAAATAPAAPAAP